MCQSHTGSLFCTVCHLVRKFVMKIFSHFSIIFSFNKVNFSACVFRLFPLFVLENVNVLRWVIILMLIVEFHCKQIISATYSSHVFTENVFCTLMTESQEDLFFFLWVGNNLSTHAGNLVLCLKCQSLIFNHHLMKTLLNSPSFWGLSRQHLAALAADEGSNY